MAKPKENTITKIDDLHKKLMQSALSSQQKEVITALTVRCHTMNINRAKLAYFKDIKLLLTKCAAISTNDKAIEKRTWLALEKELLILLNTKNG